jgi:hypothetical protein
MPWLATNEAQMRGAAAGRLLERDLRRLLQPVVIAALGDLEDGTHLLDAELISMRLDKCIRRTNSPRDLLLRLRHRASRKPDANVCPLNPGNSTNGTDRAHAAVLIDRNIDFISGFVHLTGVAHRVNYAVLLSFPRRIR